MNIIFHRVFVFVLLFSLFLSMTVDFGQCEERKNRVKRYLSFRNNTKFFTRIGIKANVIAWNQIFASAIAFRLNFDEAPETFHGFHHHITRRQLYKNMEVLLDSAGVNGNACVRRAICESRESINKPHLYHKLMNVIFKPSANGTDAWENGLDKDSCIQLAESCPLSLHSVSPYTDL